MSGRAYRSTPRYPRVLTTEWGYFAAVSIGVSLTILPHAIGSPGFIERPTPPRHGEAKACFRLQERPEAIRCTPAAEETPFDISPARAISRPPADSRRPGDSMDLFFRSLHETFTPKESSSLKAGSQERRPL